MECSRCAADLDQQYSFCPSCGNYTNLDYIISCMDDLGLVLWGHPNYVTPDWPGDWEFNLYDEPDLTKIYSKLKKENETLQSWLDELDEEWNRFAGHIRQRDEKLREQWNSTDWVIEGGFVKTPEQWEIEAADEDFGTSQEGKWTYGTDSLAVERLRAKWREEIEYWRARTSFYNIRKEGIQAEELKRLKEKEDPPDFSTRQQGSGELSKFDQLLNSTTSLIAVGLGVVLFLFSSMMIGEVSGAECTVGSSISIEMQDRCTSLANTAKYSMWGGIVSVLYGWYSK